MQVLFVVLNDTALLDDLFSSFSGRDNRATCISMGTGPFEIDSSSIPIFAALRHHLNESRPFNRTVFTAAG